MSYTTIVNDVATMLHRDDLVDVMPMFVKFAENKFNANFRLEQMIKYVDNWQLVGGSYPLPTDFIEFKWLKNLNTGKVLTKSTIDFIKNKNNAEGSAAYYTIDNNHLSCADLDGKIEGFYYAKIPSIETSTTNWLDDYRHDLYVYEVAYHASVYIKDAQFAKIYFDIANDIAQQIIKTNMKNTYSSVVLKTDLM